MKITTLLAAAMLASAPTFALAQTAAPAPTGVPGASVPAMSAADYAAMAYAGGDFLDTSSRLAYEKATDRRLRTFARAEVNEQTRLMARLGDDVATGSVAGAAPAPSLPLGGTAGSTLAGAGVGALVGGPIGALVGAGIGFTGGNVVGRMSTPSEKSAALAQLQSLPQGPEFDLAYVQLQIVGHQEAYAIHSAYAQSGDDPQLRRVARQAVPLIRQHLAQLDRLQASLGSARAR